MSKKRKGQAGREQKRASRTQERRKRKVARRRRPLGPSPGKLPLEAFFAPDTLQANCRRLEYLLVNDRRLRELRFDRKALVEGLEAYAGSAGPEALSETIFREMAPQLADEDFVARARLALHATALHLGKEGDDGAPCLFGLVCLEAAERGIIPPEENPFVELLFKVQAQEELRLAEELDRLVRSGRDDSPLNSERFATRLRQLQESSTFWVLEGESRVREALTLARNALTGGRVTHRFPRSRLVAFPSLFAQALLDADANRRELDEAEVVELAAGVLDEALSEDLRLEPAEDGELTRYLVRRVEWARSEGLEDELRDFEACLALTRALPAQNDPVHRWVYVESLRDWIAGGKDEDPMTEEIWAEVLADPLEAFVYLQAADHTLEEEGPEAAYPVYRRALQLSEDDYRALWGMARCMLAADRRARAYEHFVRALRAAEALQERRPGIVSVEELNALEEAVDACRLPSRPGRPTEGKAN